MTNKELWQAVLAQIQFNVSRANFATWFRNTKILFNQKGKIIIGVENSFSKEWLATKYSSLILKILRSLDKNIKSIDFTIQPEKNLFKILSKKMNLKLKKRLNLLLKNLSLTKKPILILVIFSILLL